MQHIDVSATTTASADTTYALLADGTSWPTWSPIESFELSRAGDDGGETVGAVRVFRTGKVRSSEQIIDLVPGKRLSYVLVDGLAIRDYRADVELSEGQDGTTTINWSSSFRPKIPGLGGLYRRTLTTFIQRCATGLAEHAAAIERPSP
ncbi:SRPBCC family protein [Phytoactinopolyspora sp. XMNu-373]|uniref:SRPBCC family protein n=1 Tax=Phytoactinopolyspora mesophila TaxID=2650750 RepID=A0A7K3M3E3_9ACTN|nr:SRPBCC family protein [Phytoactinopolyspora mesophila]